MSCSRTARSHGVHPPNAGRCPTIPSSRYRSKICRCSTHCDFMNDRGSGPVGVLVFVFVFVFVFVLVLVLVLALVLVLKER